MKQSLLILAVSSLTALGASQASASPYIGAGLGIDNTTVDTNFAPVNNITNHDLDDYNQSVTQGNAHVLAGYEADFHKQYFIAGEVHADTSIGGGNSANVTEAEPNGDEIADFKISSKRRYGFGFDVRPGFDLSSDIKLFAIAGYHWTNFDFHASAENETTSETDGADETATLNGFDYGVGAQIALNESLALRAQFKQSQFQATHIRTNDGTAISKFSPRSNQTSLDIIYSFN